MFSFLCWFYVSIAFARSFCTYFLIYFVLILIFIILLLGLYIFKCILSRYFIKSSFLRWLFLHFLSLINSCSTFSYFLSISLLSFKFLIQGVLSHLHMTDTQCYLIHVRIRARVEGEELKILRAGGVETA